MSQAKESGLHSSAPAMYGGIHDIAFDHRPRCRTFGPTEVTEEPRCHSLGASGVGY